MTRTKKITEEKSREEWALNNTPLDSGAELAQEAAQPLTGDAIPEGAGSPEQTPQEETPAIEAAPVKEQTPQAEATKKDSPKGREQELPEKEWNNRVKNAEEVQSRAFHLTRYFTQHKKDAELSLFSALKDEIEEVQAKGVYLSEPPRGVSLLTIRKMNMCLGRILYNTSFKEGTLEQNTGLIKENRMDSGEIVPPMIVKHSTGIEKAYSFSLIEFTLSSITADFFGLPKGVKPTNKQKNQVREALEAMHSKGAKFTLPNGDIVQKSFIHIDTRYYRKRDGAQFYKVLLNPYYAMEITQGFSAFPQDISLRLANIKRQSLEDFELLELLCEQGAETTIYKIKKRTLLEKMGLLDYWAHNKKKAESKLETLFSNMKSQGTGKLLDTAPGGGANPSITTASDGELMYIFYMNPDFIPKDGTEQEHTKPTPSKRKKSKRGATK